MLWTQFVGNAALSLDVSPPQYFVWAAMASLETILTLTLKDRNGSRSRAWW